MSQRGTIAAGVGLAELGRSVQRDAHNNTAGRAEVAAALHAREPRGEGTTPPLSAPNGFRAVSEGGSTP